MIKTNGEPIAYPELPGVTVLMPVYNGERYVAQAIESVLAQTYQEFEFLIMDDGSTDGTPRILADYAARDPRIRVQRHANMDQPATLNRGLQLAKHDWVAIIDHDDVCLPHRLQRQLEALVRTPEARLVGSWALEINAVGERLRERRMGPATAAEFREARRRGERIPLVHPSVLLHRPTVLELGGYDPAFGSSADTELWTRLALEHVIIVVQEPLVLYRIHSQSMSFRRLFEQRAMLRLIVARDQARQRRDPVPTMEQLRIERRWWSRQRLAELRHDLFWFFRSYCLLSSGEGSRLRAAGLAVCAAAVSPGNAIRLAKRQMQGGAVGTTQGSAAVAATQPTGQGLPVNGSASME
jgi:glycosyltransferase involved in cell wall biosynthesis